MNIRYNQLDHSIEITDIDGNETGFLIKSTPDKKFHLFEISGMSENDMFAGEFDNILDAIKEGISWT